VLQNYRQACLEAERLTEAVKQVTTENKESYARIQSLEKELYGAQLRLNDLETRESACIQEIHTLERHIDHLTHQLDLANQALRDAKDEREAILHDL
jgi:chromosome segregation ATPase